MQQLIIEDGKNLVQECKLLDHGKIHVFSKKLLFTMDNATAADSSQSNISRIYIWKDNEIFDNEKWIYNVALDYSKIYAAAKVINSNYLLKRIYYKRIYNVALDYSKIYVFSKNYFLQWTMPLQQAAAKVI